MALKSGCNIAYITLNGRIPSMTANSVGVMSMCGQFARLGLDTLLLIPDRQGMSLDQLGDAADIFEFYSVAARFKFKRFPNAFSLASRFASPYSLALVAYAKSQKVSLITTRALEVAVWAARLDVPVILESHNFSKFENHRMMVDWASITQNMAKAVSMAVTTEAGKRSYVGLGVPPERIRVLPNGVNVENFGRTFGREDLRRELGLPISSPLLVFSGSLHAGRGAEEMLDCASLLPEVQLLIVGGSPEDVGRYRLLAQQRGLTNVHLVGHVPQNVLPRYLLSADILLMPYTTRFAAHSFEYTSPMKMFEYLAAGRPMVATDFPILHEVLEHGRNAIFVPPDSGEALAQGVRQLLGNPALARQIGAAAKADAKRYSWEARAAAVIAWQRDLGHLI